MSTPVDSFLGKTCEHCGYGTTIETSSEWWTSCNECNALKFCYVPLEHQIRFHSDPSKYRMFAGKLNLPA